MWHSIVSAFIPNMSNPDMLVLIHMSNPDMQVWVSAPYCRVGGWGKEVSSKPKGF